MCLTKQHFGCQRRLGRSGKGVYLIRILLSQSLANISCSGSHYTTIGPYWIDFLFLGVVANAISRRAAPVPRCVRTLLLHSANPSIGVLRKSHPHKAFGDCLIPISHG